MLGHETDLVMSDSGPPKEVELGYVIQWRAWKRLILIRPELTRLAFASSACHIPSDQHLTVLFSGGSGKKVHTGVEKQTDIC